MNPLKLARPDLAGKLKYPSTPAFDPAMLVLDANENPWPPAGIEQSLLNRYPEQQPPELLHRLSEMFAIPANQLLVTRGGDDGIDAIIRGFCEPAEDAIVQCSPTFVMYRFLADLHRTSVIDVPLLQQVEGFTLDVPEILLSVKKARVKVLFFCSPNNPTGTLFDRRQLLEIAQAVEDSAIVAVDEAYIEFAAQPSLASDVERQRNLVVLRTLSKAYSLAGLRIGTVIACRQIVHYLRQIMVPYPLNRTATEYILRATTGDGLAAVRRHVDEIMETQQWFASELSQFEWVNRVFPSHANFLLVQVADASRLMEFCRHQGVRLRDQSSQPGLDQCIRISIGSRGEMQRLIEVFQRFEVLA